ncbi:MAG: ABC transporter permease [Actinobacteria bacterium]|nr:ABC transporter permease [Actinomycetota bacterium]
MSTTTTTRTPRAKAAATRAAPKVSHGNVIRDAMTIAARNLIALGRTPQYLVFSTIQPVIFVLMFRYVFGGAIRGLPNDVRYVDWLIPGIFVQTSVFGAMGSAIGLATDLKSGLLERFRSLPMAPSAVMAGRTLSDLGRNFFVVLLMLLVGFAVGFRFQNGVLGLAAGMLLVLFFGYVFSWVFASLGLIAGDPETAQAAAFPMMAPLVFASSVFVSPSTMPGWLRGFAEHQPVSVFAQAVRALCLGGDRINVDTTSVVLQALAWGVGILLVFVPLSVRRYRKAL